MRLGFFLPLSVLLTKVNSLSCLIACEAFEVSFKLLKGLVSPHNMFTIVGGLGWGINNFSCAIRQARIFINIITIRKLVFGSSERKEGLGVCFCLCLPSFRQILIPIGANGVFFLGHGVGEGSTLSAE